MDITFGLSGMIWLGVAIVAGILGWSVFPMGLGEGTKKGLKVLAVAGVLISTVAFGMWADSATAPGSIGPGSATWNTVATSADTHVTINGGAILVTFDVNATAFSDPGTGEFNITYTTTRTDTNPADGIGRIQIVPGSPVTNTTTSFEYQTLAKTTAGEWNVAITDSDANVFVTEATVPVAGDMRSDTVIVNYTVPVNALLALSNYGSYTFTTVVCGQTFTITIMRT